MKRPRCVDDNTSFFISRLRRLIRLRREYRDDLNPLGMRLLDRAIDATYGDCLDHGVADVAWPIFSAYRRTAAQGKGQPPMTHLGRDT